MRKIEVNKGERFGMLTVQEESSPINKRRTFICKCDCGNTVKRSLKALKKNSISSCGCYHAAYNNSPRPERQSENHEFVKTRLYSIWCDMKKRCYSKKSRAYKWYGAKGVIVCSEWKNRFLSFREWALNNGYSDDLTIDRKDSDGNYEPGNCRWIPLSEQNKMKDNRRVDFNGKFISVSELSRLTRKPYTTLIGRLNRGLTVKEAIQ